MTHSTENTRFRLSIAALLLTVACSDADATSPGAVCEDPLAIDAEEATDLYVAAWTEEDAAERACLLQRSLASDAILIATAAPIEGRSAVVENLSDSIGFLLGQGASRDGDATIQSRHDEARSAWVVTDSAGTAIERGEDWLEFNEDGLLSRIHVLSGTGVQAPLSAPLLAWQRAWNAPDAASRAQELSNATIEDVRFTDLVTDIQGRDAVALEIGRQQDALETELRLDDRVEVFASIAAQPIVIRVAAQIVLPQGGALDVVDYIRLRDGRIERLSGFPSSAR